MVGGFLAIVLALSSPPAQYSPLNAQHSPDPLIQGFLNPPPEARMRMYWRVFGPAWKKDGIDYQLKLLKDTGVGGVMLMPFYPVAVDDPGKGIHNQEFLSKEFLETFAYAARKAKELGLRFSVQGGSGWPFGGPSVKLEDAAQRIRRVELKPGATLPTLKDGERILAAWRGGQRIDPTTVILRNEGSAFGVGPGDSQNVALSVKTRSFVPQVDGLVGCAVGPSSDVAEPTTLFITGPTGMKVKRPALGAEGYVVDHYRTAPLLRWLDTNVKPILDAAPGLVESVFCDSLEVYNSNWTPDLPQEFKKRRGYDLIPRLPELFDEKAPASPDLRFDFWRTLAEIHEERWTKPLADWAHKHGVKLEMEEYGTPPAPLTSYRNIDVPTGEQYEWMGFSFSRYAASGGHLTGKRVIGAEAWTWTGLPNRLIDSLRDLKLASDYHFLAGINDLTGVDFAYSPPDVPPPGWLPYFGPVMNQNNPQWPYLKYLVQYVNRCQWLLRQGKPVAQVALYLPVEQSFAHGPIEQMPLDFLLRDHFVTGEKTGEFGLDNARKHRSELIHTLITHGYNFDGIDFWTLIRCAKVKNGKLICGDGEYSIVILPNVEGMELAALEKLAEFVRSGGTLVAIGKMPSRAFGASPPAANASRTLKQLSQDIFSLDFRYTPPRVASHHVGDGHAAYVASVADLDDSITFAQGMRREDRISALGTVPSVSTVRRRTTDFDIVLVSNAGDSGASFNFGFQGYLSSAKRPIVQLDPLTALRKVWLTRGASRMISLEVPACGSVFFLYPRTRAAESMLQQERPRDQSLTEVVRVLAAGTISYAALNDGEVRSPWTITFQGPDAPPHVTTDTLTSWTQWPGGRYFSGQATYDTTFDWNEPLPVILREPKATEESALPPQGGRKADSSARLGSPQNDGGARFASPQNDGRGPTASPQNDGVGRTDSSDSAGRARSVKIRFGEVREAGEVWVNGKLAGGVWLPPYEVEIGPLLKQGKNTLKVTVGNTMLNRFLGLPDEDLRPLRAKYGVRFPDPQEKQITKEPPPSGLIGPVEIIRE